MGALDRIRQIKAMQDEVLALLRSSQVTLGQAQAVLESLESELKAPPADPHWLLYPLDKAWPVSGEFGTIYTIGGMTWAHEGIDFACPTGCAVKASASGVVSFVGVMRGYGNFVRIEHTRDGRKWSTGYAHLSSFGVVAWQSVIARQFIGASGESGNVDGAHLHVTVWSPDSTFRPIGCTEYLRGVVNPRDVMQILV